MKTKLIALAKKGKKYVKKVITPAPFLTRSRRIEQVRTTHRICAMTFDDGPFGLPCNPDLFDGKTLTDVLLDTLNEFGAKGTFDVIGDTSENYPDVCGAVGTPAWGGTKYDHYPDFGQDDKGGVTHNDRLVRRVIDEGHQLSNHGYRHIIFGKKPFVYGKREYLPDAESAVEDLTKLHTLLKEKYDYTLTMSRPPHYVDGIRGGYDAKDVYDAMGYLYMAASFDGGGWLPAADYETEVAAMIAPMRQALEANPDCFCGHIIFQKDGYNMAKRTPIASALRAQLELLKQYGYDVVTVEELLAHSAFADVDADSPLQGKLARLALRRPIAFSDNTLRLNDKMTNLQFALTVHPPRAGLCKRSERENEAMEFCKQNGLLPKNAGKAAPLSLPLGDKAMEYFEFAPKSQMRRDVFAAVKEL